LPNKAQFIEALAQRLDGDKKRAAAALDAVIDSIYTSVAKGERVALTGFGVFEKRDRAARTARNPATGATVKVKKTSVPAFRAGSEFKAIVSGAKKMAKAPAKKAGAAAKKTTSAASRGSAGNGTSAAKSTSAAAKSTGTRGAAKKTAAKAPATKAAATKAPAKKAASKAPATKTAATKTAAKKTPAKRASKSAG
jgi:DNA-binding protein HU-beta